MRHIKSVLFLVCTLLLKQAAICIAKDELNPDGLRVLEKQSCGIFNKEENVIDGNEVLLGSRPWMALIVVRYSDYVRLACAGTLITDRFVLTAAHCVDRVKVVSVRLGEHDISMDPDCRTYGNKTKCVPAFEEIPVDSVTVHPSFESNPSAYDIALVKLSRKVDFKENISPICLPLNETLQQKVESLQKFILTGWNRDEKFEMLRETTLEYSYADRENCAKLFRIAVVDAHICAHQATDKCFGHSGSPLSSPVEYFGEQRLVQFGISTHGSKECKTSQTLSTNVAVLMPWITSVLASQ